ncbi:MAG: NfeD family protein [Candidatus Nealsonbacteria bacterium]|nr:NfeD family protein [Candidatus Nealsonbacteria bacterium]
MAIQIGDVYILRERIDRVSGYAPDKVAYSDYHPIPKGAKVTILAIEGDKATVQFKKRTEIGANNWIENKGIQEIETDALYNATDVYNSTSSASVVLLIRILSFAFKAVPNCR